ncbi:hypothetical protein PN498_28315 [Oscillatoria sp. CS-180]|uniref:hypothetical protein n=1 Tax=Oscillatoria sp. CS-180 TaxID=3021720 RepID=UPI00232D9A0E|nr:hypothetical protein [Oscillatoria sp. CS-180]MDB9529924.1 hypothetical protein [Oscillatoria sp. CS-180]
MVTRRSDTVADRVTFDIEGLREDIDAAYAENPLWARLSLAQKLRMLVEERLEEIKQAKVPPSSERKQ